MGIGKKMTKGMIGGGVNISHKQTMSGKAKSLMSYPGGMPGKQDSNGVVGKGMMQYLSGEPVGMGKYKHSSMPMYGKEKGMPEYGKEKGMPDYSKGPEKELIGNQNKLPEELKKKIEAAPPKYNKNDYGISPLSGKPYAKSVSDEQKAKDKIKADKIKKEKKGGPAKKSDLTLGNTNLKKDFELPNTKFDKVDLSKSSGKKSMSDVEKIKASKAKKQASGEKKASDAAKELKAAKESKFISRGSGEDSGVETRQGRRKKIRAARKKGREGRREVRKAKRKTVIKQKI